MLVKMRTDVSLLVIVLTVSICAAVWHCCSMLKKRKNCNITRQHRANLLFVSLRLKHTFTQTGVGKELTCLEKSKKSQCQLHIFVISETL